VSAAFAERSSGQIVLGPPKSRAGRRIVGIPRTIIPALREHLPVFVAADPSALVFPGPKGGPLRRGNFNRQASGRTRCVRSVWKACIFMICVIRGTRGQPGAAWGSET
jgi:hypothetical protein